MEFALLDLSWPVVDLADGVDSLKAFIFMSMLSFVPTPIGHLGDVTLRALEALKEADLICCEDTRHSLKLLNHYEISKPLVALHDHNEERKIPEILKKVMGGEKICVISDAGMPCVSDPGYRLLRACIEQEVAYEVLPGASSVITALVAAGFPPHPFSFRGFLAVKKGKRRKQLEAAMDAEETTLFFESPHRIPSTLEICAEIDAGHEICLARELTKKFETLHRGTTGELWEEFRDRKAKGEMVLVIAPRGGGKR